MSLDEQKQINQLVKKAQDLITDSNVPEKEAQLIQLQDQAATPDFWNRANAKEITQEISLIQNQINDYKQLQQLIEDLNALEELKGEESNAKELANETRVTLKKFQKLFDRLELNKYLSGKYDAKGAILSIHSGQGGTEAMDWAEMLSRMYLRYFERKDWKYKFISESRGEEAGIKEVSYEINHPYAYGYLKGEKGTHRLVRLSPFNADNLRQTSFAKVEILPIIEDSKEIELKEDDLSWKFTRSGGAGGQSVNKLNTAVELTHLPSGTVVNCREERSQVQNKERALKILKAKLALIEEEKQKRELAEAKGESQIAGWGTQIRNYVLHPYQLVKDTRTSVENTDTEAVLDGDLDKFIEAEIKL